MSMCISCEDLNSKTFIAENNESIHSLSRVFFLFRRTIQFQIVRKLIPTKA